jgi:hypothetical protein
MWLDGHLKGESFKDRLNLSRLFTALLVYSRHITPPLIKKKLFEGIRVLDVG